VMFNRGKCERGGAARKVPLSFRIPASRAKHLGDAERSALAARRVHGARIADPPRERPLGVCQPGTPQSVARPQRATSETAANQNSPMLR